MTWVAIGKAAGTWLLTETRRKGEDKAASVATAVMNPIVSIASDMVILLIGVPMIVIPVGGIWFFENLGTLRQFTSPAGIVKMMLSGIFEGEESGEGATSSTGDAVAAAALRWVGRDFNPGVQAQCAFFVRAVLKEAGVTMGVAPLSWDGLRGGGEGLAAAFFSDDLGQRIDPGAVRPGDLVAFTNTYGNFELGAITHVGIVVNKDGVMAIVDRPTSSAPVKFRPLDSLPWRIAYAIRPSGYKTTQTANGGDTVQRIRMAITNQESNGNCQAMNASGSGATGLGQVMPENIGPWTQAALGKAYTQAEFLADCNAQIKTLDHKINEYYQAAIARGADERTAVMQVAAQWYSGDPAKYTSEAPQYWNGNSYPSIASYSRSVLAKVEQGN